MGLTKKVLKRPVTTVLVVLCLIVSVSSSIFSSQLDDRKWDADADRQRGLPGMQARMTWISL